MSVLESKDYEEARVRLYNERIVRDMAVGLRSTPTISLIHTDSGAPTFAFMTAASAEYMKRGGTDPAHIGAVAEALLRLKKDGVDSLSPEPGVRVRVSTSQEDES